MAEAIAWLADRGVVRVAGEDATSFLQGLLTNDVERLAIGEARYAGLLTPQGKILFDMLVVRVRADTGAAYLIDCAAWQAVDLAKRLGLYKLRAKVAIADESGERAVVAAWGDDVVLPEGAFVYRDPRDPRLGLRAIVARAEAAAIGEAGLASYEALRIAACAPKGGVDFAYGDAFPHDADFDLLSGVDFGKGCYVGQEVVSRMRHRGSARKRLVKVKVAGEPPAPGTPVMDGEIAVGTLGSSAGGVALAMLRLDRVEDAKAAGRGLTAGGVGVALAD
ncbi:MAG TPA: folate-binding protein [Roseiarcus sp.]|nr:folate-binding protein [Roseiarcus sp.]